MTIRGHIQKQQRQLRQLAAHDTALRVIEAAAAKAKEMEGAFAWLTKVVG